MTLLFNIEMERSGGGITLGTTFPLCSRRLKLSQLEEIAKAMDFPSASSDDMLVMISRRVITTLLMLKWWLRKEKNYICKI